jgi:cell division septation protein DedD
LLQGGPPINLRPGEETDLDEATGIPRAALAQVEALENLDNVPDAVVSAPLTDIPTPALQVEPTLELPSAKFAFDASGTHLVQIAALRTQAAADAAWSSAVGAHPGLFTGAEKRVQRADLGAKGVFYRLRVGAFAERTNASEFCDALKERGETCIVVSG